MAKKVHSKYSNIKSRENKEKDIKSSTRSTPRKRKSRSSLHTNNQSRDPSKRRIKSILLPVCLVSVTLLITVSIAVVVILDTQRIGIEDKKSFKDLCKDLRSGKRELSYLAALELETHGKKGRRAIIKALSSTNREVRFVALRTIRLSELSYKGAEKNLINCLKDEFYEVRSSAAAILGDFDSNEVVQNLIDSLKDEIQLVRFNALGSLANIGDTGAIEPIIEIMVLDKHPKMIESAIRYFQSLGKSKHANRASDLIANYIMIEKSEEKVIMAAATLVLIGESARASLKNLDAGDEIQRKLATSIRRQLDLGGFDSIKGIDNLFNRHD